MIGNSAPPSSVMNSPRLIRGVEVPPSLLALPRLAIFLSAQQQRTLLATTMQARQQCPDPEQRDGNLSGQPLVTMGGGALPLPLPMPAQPATLTATRVATKATSTFFIGIPLFHATRYTLRASLHRWSPAEANGSPAPETVGHFKGDCVLGDTVTRRAQQNLPESGSRSAPRHPPLPVYFRAEFEGRRLRQGKLRPADSCAVVQHSINRPPTSESGQNPNGT